MPAESAKAYSRLSFALLPVWCMVVWLSKPERAGLCLPMHILVHAYLQGTFAVHAELYRAPVQHIKCILSTMRAREVVFDIWESEISDRCGRKLNGARVLDLGH